MLSKGKLKHILHRFLGVFDYTFGRYEGNFPTFSDSRECQLLKTLLQAADENKIDDFTDAVKKYVFFNIYYNNLLYKSFIFQSVSRIGASLGSEIVSKAKNHRILSIEHQFLTRTERSNYTCT